MDSDSENQSSSSEDMETERIELLRDHYPNLKFSYRGPLRHDNVKIISIYYLNPPTDFYEEFFCEQLKKIYHDIPPLTLFYEVKSYPTIQTAEICSISQKEPFKKTL